MGCQSEVYIGHYLTFLITTHDPDTGALTDADAAPTYRLYERETAAPILTGTMAKLDDANTTGFYTEEIHCSVGYGFEHGLSYTIYIRAVVDSDPGGITFNFRALTAPNDPTPAAIADAVLDEAKGSHTGLLAKALPDAAPDAAGGLPISDAGSLDLDAMNAAAVRLTTVRAAVLTDWINGGRLDLLLDAILSDTGTEGVAISATVKQAIADELLKRGVSNVEDAADAHSLATIILAVLESALAGTTWTIKKTDGTTFTTKTVGTDEDAEPVVSVT